MTTQPGLYLGTELATGDPKVLKAAVARYRCPACGAVAEPLPKLGRIDQYAVSHECWCPAVAGSLNRAARRAAARRN